ncbi:PTS mannitol transporter subunit IICB [Herbiconiux sp. CPCC 203407]|uniref:PTS system mannitol-specific EIICB component n=1 Tax=Herbiconiux oxytropis TaxID=2970915 RepID=A0AA42BU00_9MICO|nr:PTS mannitol transporter subunit IICB [Herbiconiux oxytropis]MCS5721197.1 PTS mannitol transporter subunit IICB [Herbiconiux oxytropis]MCS5724849.1 PTS mannitol transporter subunit IICB [Herbiconiux oxytropis]
MTTTSETKQGGGARVRVQRFGTFLSGMVMPNIPAFIAWGLITSLFIATGWLPNGILGGFGNADLIGWQGAATQLSLAEDGTTFPQYLGLVGPMITYMLPLLIANTGGRMVYGARGGVVGVVATMGVIVGASVPMFIGAMIMGPLGAWLIKQVDKIWAGKIKAGFEMLVDNFSAGIVAGILAIAGFFGIAPLISGLTAILQGAIQWLVDLGLLPLVSLLVEPAKVLFLNNAINHGVFTSLGATQVAETGKSILFLIEANPGPGVGILIAFSIFGIGLAKASAPGAIIIQFFGGIHEIYFPYVLSKPLTILAAMAGGAAGVAVNVLFNTGLRSPASPGSIIAIMINAVPDSYVGIALSVIVSAAVSFLITAVILRASRKRDLERGDDGDLAAAVAQTQANKGKESSVLGNLRAEGVPAGDAEAVAEETSLLTDQRPISNIVFACDAGMGSSAMGASVLRNKIKKAGIDGVTVVNKSIASLEDDVDLVITQRELTPRAQERTPSAEHVSVDNFMNSPRYEEVIAKLKQQHGVE